MFLGLWLLNSMSASVFTWPSSLHFSLCSFLFLLRTIVLGLGPSTIQDELISKFLTQLPLQRPFSQIRLYSQVLGCETHLLRCHYSAHYNGLFFYQIVGMETLDKEGAACPKFLASKSKDWCHQRNELLQKDESLISEMTSCIPQNPPVSVFVYCPRSCPCMIKSFWEMPARDNQVP